MKDESTDRDERESGGTRFLLPPSLWIKTTYKLKLVVSLFVFCHSFDAGNFRFRICKYEHNAIPEPKLQIRSSDVSIVDENNLPDESCVELF